MDRHLPAYLIARHVGVSRQLVYAWVKAGKLPAVGTAHDGRLLYSSLAASELNKALKKSPFSHRSSAAA